MTIQEAAQALGKSPQTIRRMIKRGDLHSQRVKTPQGFHYVVRKDELNVEGIVEEEMLDNSIVENLFLDEEEELKASLISRNEVLTSREPVEVQEEAPKSVFDKIVQKPEIDWQKILEREHQEKMRLISVLELLQEKLDRERRRPRSLFGYIADWWLGTK